MEVLQFSEENRFYELYQYILDTIIAKIGVTEEEIHNGVDTLVYAFRQYELRFWGIDLSDPKIFCGYLFRYATHDAGLVRCRIQNAVRNCHKLNLALQKRDVRVVSLGGGPGSDVVGFCSALFESQFLGRRLHVTIVDSELEWKICVNLITRFVRKGYFGNVSDMFRQNIVDISLIPTTLPVDIGINNPCFAALRNADIILECKFFNSLDPYQRRRIIKNLLDTVNDDAIIILIHSPFHEYDWIDFDILYSSQEPLVYQLSSKHSRFGSTDNVISTCGIHVLRKRWRGQFVLRSGLAFSTELSQLYEENYFYEMFRHILDRIIARIRITDEEIHEGIDTIINSFRSVSNYRFRDIELRNTNIICGYLFRYATHGAGLVRCRMQDAIRNCQELQFILQKRDLRVVSLGGGPGNDVVGFCSALFKSQFLGRCMHITIVDAIREWEQCVLLLQQLVRQGNFGNVSDMFRQNEVQIAFIQETLPVNPDIDNPCYAAIRNADIILECKFFNGLRYDDRRRIIQNLLTTVKDEAIIILIHSPFYKDNWTDFDVLYSSEEPKLYELSNRHSRFGFTDNAKSTCGIRVLRKHVAQANRGNDNAEGKSMI